MDDRPYVVVIGGANMDIAGRPAGPLVAHDSNMGTVRLSHGGVGRNIAHNLALMGADVKLITAFGEDAQAISIIDGCHAANIDVSHSLIVPGGATSTYLFIMDQGGEMQCAINDMAILDQLTKERLEERANVIAGAAVCFCDANLSPEAIAWVARHCPSPLFSDPISGAKCEKLKPVLGKLHTLKPNRMEAELLTGIAITDNQSLKAAAQSLLDTGLSQVFISLGTDGLYAANRSEHYRLPSLSTTAINATGAGDAMSAALAWAHLKGLSLKRAAQAGLAAAAIAVESDQTVNPQMCEEELLRRMELM